MSGQEPLINQNSATALAPNEAVRLDAGAAPIRLKSRGDETTLTSIRGIPACASKSVSELVGSSEFASAHSQELQKLWIVARLDPAVDRGGDLLQLLKRFENDPGLRQNPELLTQLYRIAAADTLYGMTSQEYQSRGIDFAKVRRECLVEMIRGVIDTDNLTQGREALCPVLALGKIVPPAELLRLATDVALNGSSVTKSGVVMEMRPEYVTRAFSNSSGELGDIKCARRATGTLMFMYCMFQLAEEDTKGVTPLIEKQQGLYWNQYTLMAQRILGQEVACMHRSGKHVAIDVDSGRPVLESEASLLTTKNVNLIEYVQEQVKRGKPVFIDTLFNFSSSQVSSGDEHCRHALVAESTEMRDGALWYRCSNPIGKFVDTSKNTPHHSEFFPTGTTLGQRSVFWFVTAENGDILVRADVLQKNIRTALVIYEKAYNVSQGADVQFIGDTEARNAGPIFFFDPSQEITRQEDQSTAETIEDVLRGLFKQHEATESPKEGDSEGRVDKATARREVKKRSPEEEAAQLIEELLRQAEGQEEQKKHAEDAKPSEDRILVAFDQSPNLSESVAQPQAPTAPMPEEKTTDQKITIVVKALFG